VAPGKTTRVYINPEARVAELKSRQRKVERTMIGITLLIFTSISAFFFIPSKALEATENWISRMENGGEVSRNASANCTDPRNKNTPYCLERQANIDSDWKSISRFQNGKTNQFTLTGR
jgi:hypothetical protein